MRQPSLAALIAFLPAAVLSSFQGPPRPSSFDAGYPDSRTIDRTNEYANVGALITMAESIDAGVPEGNLAWCTGTLIRDRVMLTAGHCVCAGLPTPPPFVRIFASFASDARNPATWLTVASIAGHPSLPPCQPPYYSNAWGAPPIRNLHDVGLVFLAEPVRGIKPARLARPSSLDRQSTGRASMFIVGYGLLRPIPVQRRWAEWEGLRLVRSKRLVQVIDEAWATWALPGEVCNGDSGGPILLGDGVDRTVVATVSYVGSCRGASIHTRVDSQEVQTWIEDTIRNNANKG